MPADEKAAEDYQHYEDYRDATRAWREERDKNQKFVAGAQYEKSTSDKYESRDQVDIVVNKIRPLLRMRTSLEAANKPTGIIYGQHKEDTADAALLQDILDWHWYNSDGSIRLEKTVTRQNRDGIGWLLVYSDNIADWGRGELKIADLSYRNVFLDKGSMQEWDASDAAKIIVTKLIRKDNFYMRYPKLSLDESFLLPNDEIYWAGRAQHSRTIETGPPQNVGVGDHEWIRELDVYERHIANVDVLMQSATGTVLRIIDNEPEPEEKLLMKKNITDQDLVSLGFDPATQNRELLRIEIKEVPVWRSRMRKSISGRKVLNEEILPVSYNPIVPIVDDDTDNAEPLGEVDFQSGIQELLNQCISLMLLNAALSSNTKTVVDFAKAGITDPLEFKERWAIPGNVEDMRLDPVTGKFPFETVRPEPLNQAWFALAQSLASEIEFQISTFGLRTGDPKEAPDTYSALLQLGQWAQDILRIPLNRLEKGLERIFNIILEWIPNYYTFHKIFHIVGDHDQPLMREINAKTFMQASGTYEILHNVNNIKAFYRIRAGSTMPSQTAAEMSIMQNLAQLEPALITSVIDRMNISESSKEEIKQTISLVQKLKAENQQKDEIVSALQTQMQHLNEQNLALQKDKAMEPLLREINKQIAIIKASSKGKTK